VHRTPGPVFKTITSDGNILLAELDSISKWAVLGSAAQHSGENDSPPELPTSKALKEGTRVAHR